MLNKNKIVIEATQTFSPGNVELLFYLIHKFNESNFSIILYVGHKNTFESVKKCNIKSLVLHKSSVLNTFIRFLKKRNNVIFFCSYPPLLKQKKSFVYFHSNFFINPKSILFSKKLPFKARFSRYVIHCLIKYFHDNVDLFYCQTDAIKNDLIINFKNIAVETKPFYNNSDINRSLQASKDLQYDFFYPATADIHKNYLVLFEAINILGKLKKVSLVVTIPFYSTHYIYEINTINKNLGYDAIINVGRISKNQVFEYYRQVKALVFPSLEESLGLPLIEAAELGIPIIGSNLPYIYEVIQNPIVFDPHDAVDISNTLRKYLDGEYINIQQKNKIINSIDDLINYFKT